MKEYQLRVVIEKADLDIKILKLAAYLEFHNFLVEELGIQDLMHQQLQSMHKYSRILGHRIRIFESDNEPAK